MSALGALVYAGLAVFGDLQSLGNELRSYAWSAFALGLALATLNYLLRFFRWQLYLHRLGVEDIPWRSSLRIFVAGFVMSVTPGKVGEVLKSVLLEEAHGTPVVRTAPIVVAERLTDLIALVILAALGSLAFEGGTLAALLGAAIAGGLWLVCAFRPLGEAVLSITERLPVVRRLGPKLREAYDSLRTLTSPLPLLLATLVSTLAWALECVSVYVIAAGFGEGLDLVESTFAYAGPTILGAVALLPGGLGVTEAGMVTLVQELAPFEASVAIAVTILVRLATLWWAVLLGAFALALHRRAMGAGSRSR